MLIVDNEFGHSLKESFYRNKKATMFIRYISKEKDSVRL